MNNDNDKMLKGNAASELSDLLFPTRIPVYKDVLDLRKDLEIYRNCKTIINKRYEKCLKAYKRRIHELTSKEDSMFNSSKAFNAQYQKLCNKLKSEDIIPEFMSEDAFHKLADKGVLIYND